MNREDLMNEIQRLKSLMDGTSLITQELWDEIHTSLAQILVIEDFVNQNIE